MDAWTRNSDTYKEIKTNWKAEIERDGVGSYEGSFTDTTDKRRLCMNSGRVDTKLRHLQTNKKQTGRGRDRREEGAMEGVWEGAMDGVLEGAIEGDMEGALQIQQINGDCV